MSGKIEEQDWARWMEDGLRRMMEDKPDAIAIIYLRETPRQPGKSNFPEVMFGEWNCSISDIGYMARQLEDIYIERMLAENEETEGTG